MGPSGIWKAPWARRLLGLDRRLPAPARKLAFLTSLYLFTMTIGATFLNVFLFKDSMDLGVVGRFNLANFLVITPAFALGGWLSKNRNPLWPFQTGLVFNALLFVAILFWGHRSPEHAVFLGVLYGLGIGFYFLGQHALTFAAAGIKHRDRFFSLHLLWSSVLRVFAPMASALVITSFRGATGGTGGDDRGYYVLFALIVVIYVFLIVKASEFRMPPSKERFELGEAFLEHLRRPLRPLLAAYFFWGLRNGVFWFIIAVLVYRATRNEMAVGMYGMLGYLVAVLTAWYLNRVTKASTRARSLMGSAWLDFASVIFLLFGINKATLLAFTIVYMTAVTWFLVPFSAYSFEFMERASRGRGREMENLTVREIPLNAGRILGLILFLAGWQYYGEAGLKGGLLLLGLGHVAVWWIFTRTMRGRLRPASRSLELEEETP